MIARAPLVAVIALAAAPVANAACPIHVSDEKGAAPLRVTFRAGCASASYRWDFGDGKTAVRRTVVHTYGGRRFRPTLTASSGHIRLTPITSVLLEVVAPKSAGRRCDSRIALRYSWPRGALAQLGERQLCKLEVTGSIPVRSIGEGLGKRAFCRRDTCIRSGLLGLETCVETLSLHPPRRWSRSTRARLRETRLGRTVSGVVR
jgi:PKD domain